MNNTGQKVVCFILGMVVTTAFPMPGAADESSELQSAVGKHGPSFVTIKFLLKMEGQFGDRENESEVTGVMIDPGGLVLASSSQLGTPRFMRRFGNATPTDIKVLIGDDTEGLPAKVLARDTELDLAWVQIKEPGKKKFEYLDLSKSAEASIGQRLIFLRKMGKYFDRAMTAADLHVVGRTHKPRDLIVPSGGASLEPGLPVLMPTGEVVGIVVLQLPDEEEMENNIGVFAGLGRDIGSGLILPTTEVVKATERAKRGEIKGDPDEAAVKAGTDKKKSTDSDEEDESPAPAKPAKPSKPADDEEDE